MSKPRIHILALGGTIATRPDSTGVMQMGLGADDLAARFYGVSRVSSTRLYEQRLRSREIVHG